MKRNKPRLILYSRGYCHLCHELLAALEALHEEGGEFADGFEIEVFDVDADGFDAQLLARYDELVPVLVAGTGEDDKTVRELCHYRLDVPAVRAYLREFR